MHGWRYRCLVLHVPVLHKHRAGLRVRHHDHLYRIRPGATALNSPTHSLYVHLDCPQDKVRPTKMVPSFHSLYTRSLPPLPLHSFPSPLPLLSPPSLFPCSPSQVGPLVFPPPLFFGGLGGGFCLRWGHICLRQLYLGPFVALIADAVIV